MLLHGLGATSEVWDGVTERLTGSWIAPDLPGHGGSRRLAEYTFDRLADALAPCVPPDPVLVGHSLGGVLALALAARVRARSVLAIGVKVVWAQEELDRAAAMAARPGKLFATREEAAERYLKVAGLTGPDAPDAGLVREPGGWGLALDNRAFGVGAPDMRALLDGAGCPVVLAAGAEDPMCRPEQLRALDPEAVVLPGLGHNAHAEDPAAVAELISR
ncbi:alpha/beta hydrolase [Kutzneria albida DSM 43870]|uniref:Alpha/beta hydrolase n=1 Tax=Kutzneria albida DSM 43870 TaxID=1449976 RepID=W5W888_9PSEU|nr:alpha/beta hydrolase [Kutzneria albida DSM 43870]